jgi:tetratricopeptide (TPR) repeat protein
MGEVMKRFILTTVILSALFVPALHGQGDNSAPQNTPGSPREKDELQARIYMARKEYAQAADLYAKLWREYPKEASYPNYIGIALLQEGKLNDARKSFEQATKVNKRFPDAYNNLGATYYAEKNYKKAIAEYRRSLGLDPNGASIYTNIGYAYFAEKQIPKAMEAFHKALELDPKVFDETSRVGSIMSFRSVVDRGLFNFILAKNYAESGDAANCVLYLRRAADEGYKEIGKARKDPAFAKVIADPGVKALLDEVAPEPPPPPPAPHT